MAKKDTVVQLLAFQMHYLNRLVENIPNDRLYERQLDGYNSAGWILGHICVEADDIIRHLDGTIVFEETKPEWVAWFRNSTGKIHTLENLPSKETLLDTFNHRYSLLGKAYTQLSIVEREGDHFSTMLQGVLDDFEAWFAHHLTTHIAAHCGNLVVWKKMIGLPVNGF